ncbi:LSU ribosomal protein L17P [Ruminococcaceae bacterium KH2T8]|nr:LSU ribosomal protein L17P [Ruminococcaceae bacterium KH2T8]
MPVNRKLGRAADQRTAILRNMTTAFVINGKVETTTARAKEISAIVEKLITEAIKEKDNFTTKDITVSAAKLDGKGKKVLVSKTSKNGNKYDVVDREVKTKTVQVDAPSRLAARKRMSYWLLKSHDSEGNVINPVNKMFDEIAPKYEGRTGGYTRIVKLGTRRGDGSEMAILEFV